MTEREKVLFVGCLVNSVKEDILNTIEKMPEEWDGVELRWFIKGKFAEVVDYSYAAKQKKKRYQDYRNTRIVNGF